MPEDHYNTPHSRASLERAIEDAISLLDFLDGDPDLELECEDEGAEHDGRECDNDSWPNPMGENRVGAQS